MNIFKKMKDILFDEEIVEKPVSEKKVEQIETLEKEEPKINVVSSNQQKEKINISEKDLYSTENTFPFPEFDEEEFDNSIISERPSSKQSTSINYDIPKKNTVINRNLNIMEYERKHKIEKRNDGYRYEKVETHEFKEKRKFKPSPIISPVYGILDADYDIENNNLNNVDTNKELDVDVVRRKAFGKNDMNENMISSIYEEVKTVKSVEPEVIKQEKVKTIDELLEDTSDIKIDMNLDDDFDKDDIITSLKEDNVKKEEIDQTEDTLEHDLLGLIDSMYENNEEEE